jgi:hypothetical protein
MTKVHPIAPSPERKPAKNQYRKPKRRKPLHGRR